MVSAAEQLVANLNLSAFAKADELKKRIWFTLGALLIYRLGTYIPIPGINPQALAEVFRQQQSGLLGMFNMFSGGAVERMAIFALEHHAVHLGIDHHAAARHRLAAPGTVEEGRRAGPPDDEPIYALRHGGSRRAASLWHRHRS